MTQNTERWDSRLDLILTMDMLTTLREKKEKGLL